MKKLKSIGAIICVILLVLLYIFTLVAAIFSSEASPGLFRASLVSTLVIPILLYAYMLVYRNLKTRKEKEDSL